MTTRGRFFQPLDMGVQIATPYNIGNLVRNNVAGPIAMTIASIYGVLLIANILFLPFAKLFGFGGLHRKWRVKRGLPVGENETDEFRLTDVLNSLDLDSAFTFYEPDDDENDSCKRKILCYFHSQLVKAPQIIQSFFRFISLNLRNAGKYKEDIVHGLGGGDCEAKYPTCEKDIVSLLTSWTFVRTVMEKSVPNIGASWNTL